MRQFWISNYELSDSTATSELIVTAFGVDFPFQRSWIDIIPNKESVSSHRWSSKTENSANVTILNERRIPNFLF
jgi:hypothetical protein